MSAEYRSIEYRLHEYLVQIQEMLTVLEFDPSFLQDIQDCKELIKNKQYTIAVMGEFKRGKSSLINALLGAKILPADATPTTATINRITYGPEPRAVIAFRDGTQQEIPIEELVDYVTKTTSDGEVRALNIKEATVYFPTVICQNHIDIIDTPGLNDEDRMTQITIEMIANVDAVIVPIHARAPFSQTEKKFVCQLIESDNINNLIFVVTFLDQLDEDDYEYEKFMEYIRRRIQTEVFAELEKRNCSQRVMLKAHRMLDHIQINGISSAQALESFVSNQRELRRKSRFEPFMDALIRNVTAKQLESAVEKTIQTLVNVVSKFEEENEKRRAILEHEVQGLECDLQVFKRYCSDSTRELEAIFKEKLPVLRGKISSFNVNKNYIVEKFIQGLSQIRQDTQEVIASVLNKTGQQVRQELQRRCETLQDELTQSLENVLWPLQVSEREVLQGISHVPGVSKRMKFDACATSMYEFIETIFGNAVFDWPDLCGSNSRDLAHCNVIERVIDAADIAVTAYIGELNQIVDTIQRNWRNQLRAYLQELDVGVTEEFAQRQEAQDLQYKAYLQNYQMFYHSAQDILQRSQPLWEEYKRREDVSD